MKLTFEVFGIPHGQGRPRAARFGKKGVRVFEAPVDRDWKGLVLRQLLAQRPKAPILSAVRVRLEFTMPMLKSFPRRLQQSILDGIARPLHARRPDADQLCKPILDMLVHAGYIADDGQVAVLEIEKAYGASPGVRGVMEAPE